MSWSYLEAQKRFGALFVEQKNDDTGYSKAAICQVLRLGCLPLRSPRHSLRNTASANDFVAQYVSSSACPGGYQVKHSAL
jgi:hypothetical protein